MTFPFPIWSGGPGGGVHTFDTKLRFTGVDDPLTGSFTCAAGVTLLVVSIVTPNTTRSGSAPTYDGNALTQAGSTQVATETTCELWYLLAPPTGSSLTVSVPNTGTDDLNVVVSSYISSTGGSVLDVTAGTTGVSTTASQAVTPTRSGAAIVDSCGTGSGDVPVSNSQTTLFSTDYGTAGDNAQYALQEDAAEITFSWTQGGGDDWCIAVAAFLSAL